MRFKATFSLLLITVLLTACAPKKPYYFGELSPPHIQAASASQKTVGYPPLYKPEGKRKTIRPGSQYFSLAIPNAIDMSGRAQDLQRSLADMLYTKLFATKRFNLLDRGELVDLDPQWLVSSLRKSVIGQAERIENAKSSPKEDEAESVTAFDQTLIYLEKKQDRMIETEEKLKTADGILLVYITSRVGKSEGGYFMVDYRIVSRRITLGNQGKEIVLFAGSQKVNYKSSTSQEVEYNRDDINAIAKNIVKIFPHPKSVRAAEVIKRDQKMIVINKGSDSGLIPGMIGYAVYSEDSVRLEETGRPRHYSYLGEFIITEVFDKTSNGILLYPWKAVREDKMTEFEWDVAVGDEVIIK